VATGKDVTTPGICGGSPNPFACKTMVCAIEVAQRLANIGKVAQMDGLACTTLYHHDSTMSHAAHPGIELLYRSMGFSYASGVYELTDLASASKALDGVIASAVEGR
jgi:hypothetical protein